MTMMTIAICDDMLTDARRLHKQLERIVPVSEIRIFKSGELLLEELEKKRKPEVSGGAAEDGGAAGRGLTGRGTPGEAVKAQCVQNIEQKERKSHVKL